MLRWTLRSLVLVLTAILAPVARAAEPALPTAEQHASAIAALEAMLGPDDRATLRFLEHLGWRFVRDPSVPDLRVQVGAPCRRTTLAEAQASGDLILRFPATAIPDAARLGPRLRAIADGVASRCAYLLRLAPAVKEATRKLSEAEERGDLVFPELLGITSPWFRFEPPTPDWVSRGDLWEASSSPGAAIESVYAKGGMAECYSAQWLAVFASQYEMYGKEFFESAWRPADVAAGPPVDVMSKTCFGAFARDGIAYPRWALLIGREEAHEDAALVLARYGPTAFVGMTGIVRDVRGSDRANQNFIVVSVSSRVTEALKAAGGTPAFYEVSRQAAELTDSRLGRLASASVRRQQRDRMKAVLEHPLFSESVVYVHPFGVVPLSEIVLREMEEIDGPIQIVLYLHGREDAFYQRYVQAWRERWLAGQAR